MTFQKTSPRTPWSRRRSPASCSRPDAAAASAPSRAAAFAGATLCLALLAPATHAESTAEARAVVDATVAAVLVVLREPGLSVDERRSRIERIAYDRFDFETMSRLVLARGWRRFSDAQQEEFVEAFKRHLSASYGSRVERYEQESVAIVEERIEPRGDVTVQTRIKGGRYDGTAVDYRLRQRDGGWRVIDVVIEGVSLVSNFRSQFAEVMARGGPEEVLRRLREKTVPEAGAA